MLSVRLCILSQDCHRIGMPFSLHHFWACIMLIYLIGNVNLPNLVNMVSARKSTIKLLSAPFIIIKCSGRDTLKWCQYSLLLTLSTFSTHQWVLPAVIIIKEELFSSPHFFIHLGTYLTSVWTHGFIFYSVG